MICRPSMLPQRNSGVGERRHLAYGITSSNRKKAACAPSRSTCMHHDKLPTQSLPVCVAPYFPSCRIVLCVVGWRVVTACTQPWRQSQPGSRRGVSDVALIRKPLSARPTSLFYAKDSAAHDLRRREHKGPFALGAYSRDDCDYTDPAGRASSGNRAISASSN